MTDLDLDRLGDLWRQPPDAAELAELKRAAETVRRRARWSQRVDAVVAIAVATVVAILALSSPSTESLLVGGGAILFLLINQIHQRRLRATELQSLTGTAEEMLDQSILRVQATLKRVRSAAVLLPPGFAVGALVAYTAGKRSGFELSPWLADHSQLRVLAYAITVVVVAWMVIHMVRQYRGGRRELERLRALRESYREERESSAAE